MTVGDNGALLHDEFNKHAAGYSANYSNPVTSGQLQDALRSSSTCDKSERNTPAGEQHDETL